MRRWKRPDRTGANQAMNPAIVIPAYNRPAALERLLASLSAAEVPPGTPLVISIDCAADKAHRPGNDAVIQLARAFRWPHGPREVIVQDEHLGLVGNVFFCGGLTAQHGAVVLLEDDLLVSRQILNYAKNALDFYGADPRVAGISLNSLWFNGFTRQPFIPLPDDGDVFFLRLSTPQGQVYTAAQWAAFTGWLAAEGRSVTAADGVHELFTTFPEDDWLAAKAKYLAATERYYVYPRESLTTCIGDPGTHFERPTAFFQVPLQQLRREFRFLSLDSAVAVYDGFYELLPNRLNRLTNRFEGLSFDVDLYASKAAHQFTAPHLITTRKCARPLMTFGKRLRPLEANVIDAFPGVGIALARREDVDTSDAATREAQRANDRYFARQSGDEGRGRLANSVRRLLGRR